MKQRNRAWRSAGLLSALALLSGQAQAAGFALIEQSVTGMGTAYAGASALANDPSLIYFNPAGMTLMPKTQASTGVHLILPSSKFSDNGSTFVNTLPIGGGNGGDANELAAVPHASLTHQIDDRTWVGLTVNTPFGLTTEYDAGWVGRYHGIKSELLTLNINPSIAYRFNQFFSIGVGVSAMYADAELTNAVDWGLILAGAGAAGTQDGKATLEGDAWGFGFNLGALFQLSEQTRIGVQYRSKVEQKIKADATYTNRPAPLAGLFPNASLTSTIELPDTASISVYHEMGPQWAVMFDYTWTGWSSVPELRFVFNSPQPDGVTTLDWKDTSRVSIGATHSPAGSNWQYRAGFAFDESPIPRAADRTPRLPGEDRYWFAFGAGYRHSEQMTFDFGYAYIIVDDPVIRKTATGEDLSRGALNGSYDADIHILSAQLRYLL